MRGSNWLGKALRLLRQRQSRYQNEVARTAGISPARLSSYERGEQQPAISSVVKVLVALGHDFRGLQDALDATGRWPRKSLSGGNDTHGAGKPEPSTAPQDPEAPLPKEMDLALTDLMTASHRLLRLLLAAHFKTR
jgi:transcriptional regulator with XRE-family HTH domain